MNCEIFRILYLRANAEIACNCGSGEKINLGWGGDDEGWSATRLFANERYQHMARSFQRNELPWGDVCKRCVFLRPNEPFRDGAAEKQLERIHLEPSLACALRCPGCSRIHQAKERKGPTFMPVDVYRRVVGSLSGEGYSVGLFYFCGQGEPLSHPKIEQLIAATRQFYPKTPLVINTNGNYRFGDVLKTDLPDKLIVSVDGLYQQSYEQYRINGDVATALQFMRDAKALGRGAPAVEWKYILFRYNDSDEEIIAAQHKAEELGIDSLQFVLTHTPEKSLRYRPDNIDELPIVSPIAYPETTPHLYFKRPLARPRSQTNSALAPEFAGAGKVLCVVDECRYWAGRLMLRGWAADVQGRGPASLSIRLGGHKLGNAGLGLLREDVAKAMPHLRNRHTGFSFSGACPAMALQPETDLTIEVTTSDGAVFPFTVSYEFLNTGELVFNENCP